MRTISCHTLVNAVANLVVETCVILPDDVLDAVGCALKSESFPVARSILGQIVENAAIAREMEMPLCQDTGLAVMFVEMGGNVRVDGAGVEAGITEGVRKGYREGGLRMSVVRDPLRRENTGDNTPAIIHYRIIPGDSFRVLFCPKGGGCENASRLAMLSPGEGREGVVKFVIDTVRMAGGRPCPPIIAGVGIGGDFERCAIAAKRSLFRKIGARNPDPFYAELERELLEALNALGVGPMGLGGRATALDVFVEAEPCHIASLPVAVNIQCHSARHGEIYL